MPAAISKTIAVIRTGVDILASLSLVAYKTTS